MFGDLFAETAYEGIKGALVCAQDPAPPRPRLSCKFAGIDNQGATCYLNSLLQTLLLTSEFKEKLFQLSEKDLGSLEYKDEPQAKVRVIPIQLQRLFAQLLLSDQQSVSTLDLTNSFGWTNQEGFQQHDVQELNRILFCAIEESLVGTPGQNIINELYRGTFVNQIKCTRCKKVSEREEDFLDLTVAVAGMSGMEAALKASYVDVETMNGCNQYRCEPCGMLTDATKGAKLRNLPPILTISLLRFSFDFVKMSRFKENGRFAFPMQLDMSPYCDKNSSKEDNLYDLFSVVVHRGGAYGGHYFAYIRDIDNLGHWTYEEGCKKKSKVDPASTGLDIIECESPVDLVETILSKEPHQAMSVEKLCGEITKVTGVSWSKRFKKSHGAISKFLKSNDAFSFNADSNWVSLATPDSANTDTKTNGSSVESPSPQSSQPTDETTPEDRGASANVQEPGSQDSPPGHRWFCFNDSSVSPILPKEIERQFSGKESAYMLFYRHHNLQRPVEAEGQLACSIPERFVQEAEAVNDTLRKQRLDHELKTNSTKLKIYQADQFVYRELLQLINTDSEVVTHKEVAIDRRSTVTDLRAAIQQVLKETSVQNLSIHVIKEWFGGFSVCHELKDNEASLQDLHLVTGTSLLVWNGSVLDDQFVEEGPAHDPIKLLILLEAEQQPVGEVVLRRSRSLKHLYELVADLAGLDANTVSISTGADPSASESVLPLPSDPHKSVTEAGLTNDDVLLLSSRKPDGVNRLDSSSAVCQEMDWSVTIVEQLSGDTENNTISLNVKSSLGLRELKEQSIQMFGFDATVSAEAVRLREVHHTLGLQPPLREGLSLQDSGLSNGLTLMLETGRPPQDSEMTISVNKMVAGKLVHRREFLVDRQLTVKGMLEAACQLMDCNVSGRSVSDQWYLSKTDMYGDSAEPLDNDAAALLDLLINDGDTLVLQEGSVVRKDQACLIVWLHTDLQDSLTKASNTSTGGPGDRGDNQMVNGGGEKEEDKVMLDLAAKLSVDDPVDPHVLNPLNKCLCPKLEEMFDKSLVVDKNTSIEELKLALMATECFQVLRIPTPNFMRLRVLEGGRLRAVIKSNSQALRHVSPKEVLNVAVQVLPEEETLGNHELLLNVAVKIGGSRMYMPAKEFVWNTSGGQGAVDLRKAVTSRLGLPSHDASIAKYNPDTSVWTVIKDSVQKPSKGKGKKKSGSGKCNIRQSPYYIQDGDLIGVKVLSLDKGVLGPEDFNTQEDLDQQLLLQKQAEEKRRMREEKKNECWMDGLVVHGPSKRRTEVPLTIRVDKFS